MSRNINISLKGSGSLLMISLFLLISIALSAQADKKSIRKGNREYGNDKFPEAEILYRKAIDDNKQSPDAIFNIGDALYKQKKYEDAGKQFIENTNQSESKEKKSAGLYNLGNSMLMSNKLKESIEAYKGSLKLNPDSKEAKYNLAYAQDLLKQQEEEQKKQDKQDQKKDDKNQDQNKDNKDKDKDQQKDQEKKDDKQNDQNKDQQQQQQSISKEDAQRLLNALANDEKNVQEKVKLAKAAKAKVKTVKNW
jgi:Ca-activated chloride channel family protein